MYYKAIFIYNKEGIPKDIKRFVEKQYNEARNKAVELLNPNFEKWNEEYGPVNGDIDRYNKFIQEKEQAILDEFNRTWMGPVKLYADEEADIVGKFKVYNDTVTMRVLLKEV